MQITGIESNTEITSIVQSHTYTTQSYLYFSGNSTLADSSIDGYDRLDKIRPDDRDEELLTLYHPHKKVTIDEATYDPL